MKKGLILSFLLVLLIAVIYYQKDIVSFALGYTYELEKEENSTVIESNEYKSNFDYMFIKNTLEYYPKSKDDLKSIYYTFINSGMKNATIYCDKEYETCTNDATSISNNVLFLNTLNNYVHPFNSYQYIQTEVYNNKLEISLTHTYTNQEIDEMNSKVNEIISNNINNNMTTTEKIKTIHDYIINNVKYDETKHESSSSAHKALFSGIATCGGYTDLMSIFLYKLNIPNYKISTNSHIWNYVKVDGKWYHLDLTWDDPMTNTGEDVLMHNYFLIDTKKIEELDKTEHTFDKELYPETKN